MVKRVFITSEFGDDSLPKWASWLKVVVDGTGHCRSFDHILSRTTQLMIFPSMSLGKLYNLRAS